MGYAINYGCPVRGLIFSKLKTPYSMAGFRQWPYLRQRALGNLLNLLGDRFRESWGRRALQSALVGD